MKHEIKVQHSFDENMLLNYATIASNEISYPGLQFLLLAWFKIVKMRKSRCVSSRLYCY